jgi:SsrA-binding protein
MAKAGPKAKSDPNRRIADNRRAHFEYELGERYEAGMVLIGSEARSLRDHTADLSDAWVEIRNGEAWVRQMRIPHLNHAAFAHEEVRPRKLLLHKAQIEKLRAAMERDRMTLVVTKAYYKEGRAKLEIAVGRGRKAHDKRQAIRDRESNKEARDAVRAHSRRS